MLAQGANWLILRAERISRAMCSCGVTACHCLSLSCVFLFTSPELLATADIRGRFSAVATMVQAPFPTPSPSLTPVLRLQLTTSQASSLPISSHNSLVLVGGTSKVIVKQTSPKNFKQHNKRVGKVWHNRNEPSVMGQSQGIA